MNQVIECFLLRLSEASHLKPLITKDLSILIKCNELVDHSVYVNFSSCTLTQNGLHNANMEIQGNEESMITLFTGKKTLRELVINGQLSVKGSYRVILQMESIFLLNK